MKNPTETKLSAYLRLAELCGPGEEEKRKEYMRKAEELLSEPSDPFEKLYAKYHKKLEDEGFNYAPGCGSSRDLIYEIWKFVQSGRFDINEGHEGIWIDYENFVSGLPYHCGLWYGYGDHEWEHGKYFYDIFRDSLKLLSGEEI